MGSFSPTIASNPTSQNSGKGSSPTGSAPRGDFGDPAFDNAQPITQFQGKGGSTTNSATSGQPQMGAPQSPDDMYQPQRRFPNTIQPWDNAQIKTQTQSGKGKG
jgi:hypothetical protein